MEILTWPHPNLHRAAADVAEPSDEITTIANEMLKLMYEAPGIGLAANQVGILKRIMIIDSRKRLAESHFNDENLTPLEKKLPFPLLMLNPEILRSEGDTIYEEGCLSVPGYFESVRRPSRIEFKYRNLDWSESQFEVDGLTAVCVQHELDHLNGKLFIDHLSPIRKNLIKNKIRKFGYPEVYEHRSAL